MGSFPIDETRNLQRRSRELRRFAPGTRQEQKFSFIKDAINAHRISQQQEITSSYDVIKSGLGDKSLVTRMREYISKQNLILSKMSSEEKLKVLFPGYEKPIPFYEKKGILYKEAFDKGLVKGPSEFWTKVKESGFTPEQWIVNQSPAYSTPFKKPDHLLLSNRLSNRLSVSKRRPIYKFTTSPAPKIYNAPNVLHIKAQKIEDSLKSSLNLVDLMQERGQNLLSNKLNLMMTYEIQQSRTRRSSVGRRSVLNAHQTIGNAQVISTVKEKQSKKAVRKTVEKASASKTQGAATFILPPKLEDYTSQGVNQAQQFEKLGAMRKFAPYAAGIVIGIDVLSSRDKTGPFWGGITGAAAWLLTKGRISRSNRLLSAVAGYGIGRIGGSVIGGALEGSHNGNIEGFAEKGESSVGRKQLTQFGSGYKGISKTVNLLGKTINKLKKLGGFKTSVADTSIVSTVGGETIDKWHKIYIAAQARGEVQKAVIKSQQERGVFEKLLPTIKKDPFTYRGIQSKIHKTQEFAAGEVNKALQSYAQERGIKNVPNLWATRASVKIRPIKAINTPAASAVSLSVGESPNIGGLSTVSLGPKGLSESRALTGHDLKIKDATDKIRQGTRNPKGLGLDDTIDPNMGNVKGFGLDDTINPNAVESKGFGLDDTINPDAGVGKGLGFDKTINPNTGNVKGLGFSDTINPNIGKDKAFGLDKTVNEGVVDTRKLELSDTINKGGSRPKSINELGQTLDAPVSAFHKTITDPFAGTNVDRAVSKTHIGSLPTLSDSKISNSISKFERNLTDFALSSPHGALMKQNHPRVLESFTSQGVSGAMRKEGTDFGTGWDPARRLAGILFKNSVKAGKDVVARGKAFREILENTEFQKALTKGKVVKKLGEGGYGSVELMETELSGKKFRYARKSYLKSGGLGEPKDLMRGEIKGLKAIQGSIGPTPYGTGKAMQEGKEVPAMYFEALEGFEISATAAISQGGFSRKQTKELWNAVERLHKKKLTHSDIKPDNILLNKEGQVALIDPFPDRFKFAGWEAIADTETITKLQKSQDLVAIERIAKGGNTEQMLIDVDSTSNALSITSYYNDTNRPFSVKQMERYLPAAREIYKRAGATKIAEQNFGIPMVARKRTPDMSKFPGAAGVLEEAGKPVGQKSVAASPRALRAERKLKREKLEAEMKKREQLHENSVRSAATNNIRPSRRHRDM
jgi:hypothetical protein